MRCRSEEENTGEGNKWKNTRNREGADRKEGRREGRANKGGAVQVWRESRRHQVTELG